MRVSELFRRVAVLGGPAALGLLEIWHPHFDSGDMSTLIPQVNTWLLVHLLQIPLFGAAALTLYLLAGRAGGWFAHASRLAVGVFVVLYIALDSVAGVAVGLLVQRAGVASRGGARGSVGGRRASFSATQSLAERSLSSGCWAHWPGWSQPSPPGWR